MDALVPVIVAEVLRRVDLTELIIRPVDLDRVVAEVAIVSLEYGMCFRSACCGTR